MEPKPKTLGEALDRMRDPARGTDAHFADLADAIEILVILGFGEMDRRDLDVDVTDYRGSEE